MGHANDAYAGIETTRLDGPGLLLGRNDIRSWLNGETPPSADRLTESAPAQKADDSRDVVHVLLFGLVMLGLLLLVRHVRMSLPGDFPVPTRAAVSGSVSPVAWSSHALVSGARPESKRPGSDRLGDHPREGR